MRIFITGASGFIGNAVAKAFRLRGHEVLGLVRKEHDSKLLKALEIEPVIGTIASPQSFVPAAKTADVLINCAFDYSGEGIAHDSATIDALLSTAKTTHEPRTLIYTSGIWVYGSTGDKWIDETTPVNPLNLVKWRPAHEQKVLQASSKTLQPIVIRPGIVYGGKGSLTAFWFDSIAKHAPQIVGDGQQRYSMVHVDDLAELYVLAAEKKNLGAQIFNATNGANDTVQTNFEAVAVACHMHKPVQHLTQEQAFKLHGGLTEGLLTGQSVLSEKAQKMLSWKARHAKFTEEAKIYFDAWQAHQ